MACVIMDVVGEIRNKSCSIFEWRIIDFFALPVEVNSFYSSPIFEIFDAKWILQIYPYGSSSNDSTGWITLCLCKLKSKIRRHSLHYKLGLKRGNGKEFESFEAKDDFREGDYSGSNILKRCQLMRMKDVVAPDSTLTVFCLIYSCINSLEDDESDQSMEGDQIKEKKKQKENNDYVTKETARTEGINPKDKGKRDGTNETEGVEQSETKESVPTNFRGFAALSQNLEDIFLSSQDSDVTIEVKDRVFQAHKVILRARSRIFDLMLQNKTKQKSYVVDIADCDPCDFECFLFYLYTGRVDKISSDNAIALYEVADEYDVKELKSECLQFITESLSVDLICDVISLAVRHDETGLTERTAEFFTENIEKILLTTQWQLFMKENPRLSNKLCIKAFSGALAKS